MLAITCFDYISTVSAGSFTTWGKGGLCEPCRKDIIGRTGKGSSVVMTQLADINTPALLRWTGHLT